MATPMRESVPRLLPRRTPLLRWLVILCALSVGCTGLPPRQTIRLEMPPRLAVEKLVAGAEILPCAASEPAAPSSPTAAFAGVSELTAEVLVEQVLTRNPSLAQMVAAWQAASARYPQVTSLDDPMLGASLAPAAPFSDQVNGGYRLEVSQKLPWCGKLALRGQQAQAEALAAGDNIDDMRLQLAESARAALADYYLVARALEVNEENAKLLREARDAAEARYTKSREASQQDISQADVEIGRQQERQLTLERMRLVAVARINTLLHLPPDLPLPPPPGKLALGEPLPEVQVLREAALRRRPDLAALANRLAADQAAVCLAQKEFYPDIEVMASYDAFWQEKPLRAMVGVRVNLPLRLARRDGAVAEAAAKVAERQAELARQADQVSFEVQQAHTLVQESERAVRLYEKSILKAARENVEAAGPAYASGKIPFLSLLEAQRAQVGLRDRYFEALADYHRRRATLERAVGGPLFAPTSVPTVPPAPKPAPPEKLPEPRPADRKDQGAAPA